MALPTPEILAQYTEEQKRELSSKERLPEEMRGMLHSLMNIDISFVWNQQYRRRLGEAQEDADSRLIDVTEPPPEKLASELADIEDKDVAHMLQAPLLGRELGQVLFAKMNYSYSRASQLQQLICGGKYGFLDVSDLQYFLQIAEETKQRLIKSNHRLSIAEGKRAMRRYRKIHELSIGDCISEGYPILRRCVSEFDIRYNDTFSTFAAKSLRNHFSNLMQRGSKAGEAPGGILSILEVELSQFDDLGRVVGRNIHQAREVLGGLLDLLEDDKQQEVIRLRHTGMGLSQKEAAEEMGISVGMVNLIEVRARLKLKKLAQRQINDSYLENEVA